ncbi:Ser-Thr-rich glycosyl-phosphatidyl-inositol-anchored membrane family-domain-containing protein [Lasiosphaeria miniovina]|uniref:Ser-Thr-rich glycosyl-phosphatidyl-inositol-anchored membrane family-domain-containing protein n=1 Tax=Lasiosphaeria miniovina TaxID=1954250 RepID=A0AA40DJU6_9PEZI|nr:Ser-Thr-rich glycosyl-phosphatidyl-inositol-anchored membrane family-domain-containing protein [Lasiosphaeria miniovina]KAK0704016.1 Ser-Thr-rich glycosyl-phosphatidyl-inositol-anchored membrane family-domain-containing protein [Lasiosphaeria miniovina]
MRSAFISAAALFACVQAIRITSPTKDDTIDPSKGVTVKWSTVSTDPKTAHLVLVNQAGGHTPYSKDLGEVDLTKGSVTVTVANVPNDTAYQFNIESVTELNTGILAQSAQFEVEAGASGSSPSPPRYRVAAFWLSPLALLPSWPKFIGWSWRFSCAAVTTGVAG